VILLYNSHRIGLPVDEVDASSPVLRASSAFVSCYCLVYPGSSPESLSEI
jgi:hypothetical protein